jgi:hypothetical protein
VTRPASVPTWPAPIELAVFSGDDNNAGPVDSGCERAVHHRVAAITTDQTPKSGAFGDTINDRPLLHGTSNLLGTAR